MDIVLDSCILIDFLDQYTKSDQKENNFILQTSHDISEKTCKEINKLISSYSIYPSGYIVVSTFSFTELARKIDSIKISFTPEQLKAFLDQPPEWLYIQSTDPSLLEYLEMIPKRVMRNSAIEWADAIIVATALTRQAFVLATTDIRIKKIPMLKGYLLY